MTKFDAFNTKGFDAFVTPGFDARNATCVPTTFLSTGRYVWGVGLPPNPTYSFDGNVGFDSRGRMWVAPSNIFDRQPDVYDAQANLLLTGPAQSGRLLYPTGAGQGACVMAVFDETVHIRANKLVCFDAEDASVKWTYDRPGAAFGRISYVNGIVFAFFTDHDDRAPGFDPDWPLFDPDPAPIISDVTPKWKTIALDALTGAVLGTAAGVLLAVTPDSGIVVFHNYDDFLRTDPYDNTSPLTPRDYIRYQSDLSTVAWTKTGPATNAIGFSGQVLDVDETGTAWLLVRNTEELISIDPVGVEAVSSINVRSGTWSWGVQEMAIDLCAPNPRAFLRGSFRINPQITPNESTLQILSLANPSINPEGGNFPSTIGDGSSLTLGINGKWSIFT